MNIKELEILEVIKNRNIITVSELESIVKIPRTSLLRYLDTLGKNGSVTKTFGEVRIRESHLESSAFPRLRSHVEDKKVIASKASKLIKDGEVIFIDGGSTNFYIAETLSEKNITIYTNNLLLPQLIDSLYKPNVVMLGGNINKNTMVTASAQTIVEVKDLRFDKCFIGFNSLVGESFSTTNSDEAVLKKQVIRQTTTGESYLVGRDDKSLQNANFTFINKSEVKIITHKGDE